MADNFKYAQLQPFSLAGSGAIIGDTSLTLKSMTDIDGNLVTMSSFGTVGFGTIDPGNGTLEEQISWTGITQNANGTATLTGVSNVLFIYPYTKTSGLLKTHAGATTMVVSNTSGFYDSLTAKTDDETITGTYTFTQPNFPQMDGVGTPPSLPAQLVTKSYADSLSFAGAPNASTSAKGLVQIATQAQTDARTLIGSTSAVLVSPPTNQRSTLLSDYVIDTSGSPNVIVIAPSPAITSYVAGQEFSFKVANTNTSPTVSINVNGLGAKNISVLSGTSSPSIGDFVTGGILKVEYDGTNFQAQTPPVQQFQPSGSIIMYGGAAAPQGWLLCNGSAVSRTTYSTLFSVISTLFGTGDGTTTFNVPNMSGKFVAGPSASLSTTIGATGGALTSVVTGSITTTNVGATGGPAGFAGAGTYSLNSGLANTVPPYVITNYLIKT